ncbi:hypothetical protein [Bradyrhizobium sp. AZCC 2289]|uniref:hypothetical protein n=1 Tax=Bradyrhizobium sp. AZCC 2289 TaxID=3117026 RepID=UPI002FF0120B
MQIAKTNKPVGTRYDRAIGAWLAESKLDGITNQERYRALLCLENLGTVEAWRADLNDAQRRQPNHPNAVWFAWRRSMKAREPKPAREPAKVQGSNQARADFEQAWQVFLANRTETDFQAWRDQRDWTARKYAMWKAGEKLPSQNRVR